MDDTAALRSDWLGAFLLFAEHRSFTRAAKLLHLSQPAVHVQITKLADALGVPLYVRRGRSLELTREGVRLLAFAREAQERSRELVADVRGESVAAPVVLCSGEGAYLYLLGDAVRAFAKRQASTLRLLTRDAAGTIDAVASGEAHLGVASIDDAPDGIVVEPLCDVDQVLVVPRSHPLARKRVVGLGDLEGLALVVPPAGRPHRAMISRALQAAGVSWTVAAEANGWGLLVHFAALGMGAAIVNGFCRIPAGLVARPLRGLPSVRYSLLLRRGAHPSGPAEALRRQIEDGAHGSGMTTRLLRARR